MMASGSCEENVETEKRQQFGNRYLTDPQNVFQHNAWDNVVWDSTQEEEAKQKTQQQLADALPEEDRDMYEEKASHFWDEFYNIHTNRFFKDRHWLFVEFPELYSTKQDLSSEKESNDPGNSNHVNSDPVTFDPEVNSVNKDVHNDIETVAEGVADINLCKQKHTADRSHEQNFPGEHAKFRILEVGCGVGNTVFPVLQTNNDPDLMVYCCDFSSSAIQIVKDHADYNPERCHPFVCDISNPDQIMPMPEGSLDIVIMIFVLSAINPDRMQSVIDRLSRLLKPGGQFLFRDYGRYDMAQLRFKKGRCLSENFYVRGDGTRVYFFTQEELKEMFTKAGLVENQNLIDRRLQVNRGKQLKMYRVWLQCKYQKPKVSTTT